MAGTCLVMRWSQRLTVIIEYMMGSYRLHSEFSDLNTCFFRPDEVPVFFYHTAHLLKVGMIDFPH